MSYQPVLEVTRGGLVESIHFGAVVVADASGDVWARWGDPETVTFLRSSAKPFQCLPLLESGAAAHYDLAPKQIAVICASHSGTDEHVQTVASIQATIGVTEADLMCGVHQPYNKETAQRLKDEGLDPTPNRHNCSGKHSGMLGLARFLGAPLENYIDRDHPIQRLILETFAGMCGLDTASVSLGIDGCSVPTFAVPLRAAARAYARLMDPSGLPSARVEACRRVVAAMTSYPNMVAGPDRFDTRLMEVTKKRLLSKGGAEGNQGIGIPPGALGPDSSALGVAIKIADGDLGGRAVSSVAVGVLEALGAIDDEEREELADFGPKTLSNFRGLAVGQSRVCFQLQRGT
jgi:L-asparaginase II